jgi:hypothetical protein
LRPELDFRIAEARVPPVGRVGRCLAVGDVFTSGLTGHVGGRDGLEVAVTEELRALGWEPTDVCDAGAFGIDLAIEDPRTGLFGIGIECDAPRHPLLECARAREVWRPQVLRRSVPVLHRVSSHRWFHEPDVERARLRTAVAHALGERT